MNPSTHAAMPNLSDACADEAEILALSCIRLVAAGYSTGDVACWDLAYTCAERVLDPEPAGKLVAGVTALLRAVRAERLSEWHFLPATCCRVTQDEVQLVRLMAASRGHGAAAIHDAALEVAGAAISRRLETAACIVARALDEAAETLVAPARRPQAAASRVH